MREKGGIIVDGKQVGSTYQCCHCGGHFEMIKGSGKVRGFCLKCNQITCGSVWCDACIPVEKKLELMEKHVSLAISRIS